MTDVELHLVGFTPDELEILEGVNGDEALSFTAPSPVLQYNCGISATAKSSNSDATTALRIRKKHGKALPRWERPPGFEYRVGQRFLLNPEGSETIGEIEIVEVTRHAMKVYMPLGSGFAWWKPDTLERVIVELLPPHPFRRFVRESLQRGLSTIDQAKKRIRWRSL